MSTSKQKSLPTPRAILLKKKAAPQVTPICTTKPLLSKTRKGRCSYVIILYNPKDVKQSFIMGNKHPHDIYAKINTTLEVVRSVEGYTSKSAYSIIDSKLPYLSKSLCAFLASVQHRPLKAIVIARYTASDRRGVQPMLKQRLDVFKVKMEDEYYANAINLAAVSTV